MDGSWEPVCAVRDKPEKQNLVCLRRGGRESCFQVSVHVKIAVCFPSGFSSVKEGAAGRSLNTAPAAAVSVMWENIAQGIHSLILWAPSARTWLNKHVLSGKDTFLINTSDVQGMWVLPETQEHMNMTMPSSNKNLCIVL